MGVTWFSRKTVSRAAWLGSGTRTKCLCLSVDQKQISTTEEKLGTTSGQAKICVRCSRSSSCSDTTLKDMGKEVSRKHHFSCLKEERCSRGRLSLRS